MGCDIAKEMWIKVRYSTVKGEAEADKIADQGTRYEHMSRNNS